MVAACQLMQDRIEEKYAASDRQKEYDVAADGSMQEIRFGVNCKTISAGGDMAFNGIST